MNEDGNLNGTRGVHIAVHEFSRRPDPVRDGTGKDTGEVILRDYVRYGQPHLAGRQETTARVDRVLKAKPPHPTSRNLTAQLAWERAEYIRPLYEAWLKGEELPDGGISLAACNFITADEAAILKGHKIKSAQDLANCHDNLLDRIPLPAMRQKRKLAQAFINAQDANAVIKQMSLRDAEIEELKRQVAALAAAKEAPEVDENGDRIPQKRGPGRPPKASREADTEHEAA